MHQRSSCASTCAFRATTDVRRGRRSVPMAHQHPALTVPDPVLGDVRIILVAPKEPRNIGAVCRVAANFESPPPFLVFPRCDPFSSEAQMVASSCPPDYLQGIQIVDSVQEALFDTEGSIGFTRRAGATRVTHRSIRDLLKAYPLALPRMAGQARGQGQPGVTGLVFGREESGLSQEELNLCTHACAIPTGRVQGSMNLSHSVAAVQAELFQRRLLYLESPDSHDYLLGDDSLNLGHMQGDPSNVSDLHHTTEKMKPATAGEIEALLKKMATVAEFIGASTEESSGGGSSSNHGRKRRPLGHMRAVLSKARPTQAEIRSLHGFASLMLEKFEAKDST